MSVAETKIYISGKITGMEEQARELFAKTEQELIDKGYYYVINPMELKHEHDKSWESYMKECVKALCNCDVIYLLPNWSDSKGATIEKTIAEFLGIKIHYYGEL